MIRGAAGAESFVPVETRPSFQQNPGDYQQHAQPHGDRELTQAADAATQQEQNQTSRCQSERPRGTDIDTQVLGGPKEVSPGMRRVEVLEAGAQPGGEFSDGDEARAHLERSAQQELPDEQKGYQPAPA